MSADDFLAQGLDSDSDEISESGSEVEHDSKADSKKR